MDEKRLLVLDDDPGVGQTICLIAESAGFKTSMHTEANQFFQALLAWNPTHIALDLVMPDMDGVEVIAELAERGCRSQIIITSGVGDRILDAAGRSASEHGLNILGVLSKPFFPASLIRLLDQDDPANSTSRAAGQSSSPWAVTKDALTRAIEQQQLVVAYQPKIDCRNGLVAGFESLVRWQHPEHGLIMPDRFIPFAETNDLIGPLTENVFEQALGWFQGFQNHRAAASAGDFHSVIAPDITLSVNISALSLKEIGLADRMDRLCQSQGVSTEKIIFELTETSAMEDPVQSLDLLTRLRMKGFHLSIDDFGTGFSSMIQLVRLPFSEIKVDKSFVINAMKSRESRTITRSIIDLGQSLGLRVTAEGVEDGDTLGFLRAEGCDLAQGFHIARPMPAEAISTWLSNYRPY